jgi:hypothetical protein
MDLLFIGTLDGVVRPAVSLPHIHSGWCQKMHARPSSRFSRQPAVSQKQLADARCLAGHVIGMLACTWACICYVCTRTLALPHCAAIPSTAYAYGIMAQQGVDDASTSSIRSDVLRNRTRAVDDTIQI